MNVQRGTTSAPEQLSVWIADRRPHQGLSIKANPCSHLISKQPENCRGRLAAVSGIAAIECFQDLEYSRHLFRADCWKSPGWVNPKCVQMAADSTEQQPTNPPAADGATAATTTEPPKKFPKGVVLGKDGKP